MNAQIGQLIRAGNPVFYAYVGADRKYTEGTVAQLEAQLDGKQAAQTKPQVQSKTYTVKMTFQFPAWDEKDGIIYRDITATSKKEANEKARKMADGDGYLNGGQGRVSFAATEE